MGDSNKNNDICKIKEHLSSYLLQGLEGDTLSIHEAYEIADIIKDMAETERNCNESCYYETVVKAMEEGEEPKYGYSARPYMLYKNQEPYIDAYVHDPNFKENMRMGYSEYDKPITHNQEWNRYGKAYNEYLTAKKHYTATNDATDKENMMTHMNEHLSDAATSIRKMWDDADPNMRRRIKTDVMKLAESLQE